MIRSSPNGRINCTLLGGGIRAGTLTFTDAGGGIRAGTIRKA